MKSFKFYIVSLLVIGIAVGCADEHRAFKPKSTLGALGVAEREKVKTPPAGDGELTAEQKAEKEKAEKEQAEKDAKEAAAKDAAAKALAQKAIDDNERQKIESFNNENKTKPESKSTVSVNVQKPVSSTASTTSQSTKAAEKAEAEEESEYLADEKKRAEAFKTIIAVSVFRAVEATESTIAVEVLSLIKINNKDEKVVSRGLVALAPANEDGVPRLLSSSIMKEDTTEVAIDDVVKVRGSCALKENSKTSDGVHCDSIILRFAVKYVSSKDGKDETTAVFAVYRFKLPADLKAFENKDMIAMEAQGATVGKNFKYYEDALGLNRMPKLNKKAGTAEVKMSEDDVLRNMEAQQIAEALKKSEPQATPPPANADKPESTTTPDPFEEHERQMDLLRKIESKSIDKANVKSNDSVKLEQQSTTAEDLAQQTPEMRAAARIEEAQIELANKKAKELVFVRGVEQVNVQKMSEQAAADRIKAEEGEDFSFGTAFENFKKSWTGEERTKMKWPWETW